MTKMQHYQKSATKLADRNRAFMELVNHPTNPMTNEDLKALIERRPEVYGTYKGFLGKLKEG